MKKKQRKKEKEKSKKKKKKNVCCNKTRSTKNQIEMSLGEF